MLCVSFIVITPCFDYTVGRRDLQLIFQFEMLGYRELTIFGSGLNIVLGFVCIFARARAEINVRLGQALAGGAIRAAFDHSNPDRPIRKGLQKLPMELG